MDNSQEELLETGLEFDGKNVPIAVVASVLGLDNQSVRQAMIKNYLPIGFAFKKEGSSQYTYYVSPKKLYEFTGYLHREGDNK